MPLIRASQLESKEASDEEYQSANEEILSANEELQSTNEELETSKEELQSANEELNTVNDELQNRNVELDRLNSDLRNVLSSTNLPVVMVDRSLRIRRLTAASAKALKIVPSDIGRPIMEIRSDIEVLNLDELIVSVIETLTPQRIGGTGQARALVFPANSSLSDDGRQDRRSCNRVVRYR